MLKKPPPYIYEYYNLFAFMTYDTRVSRNILTRLLNAMVEGFNRREHLPKYILMILDKNIVEAATAQFQTDFGIKNVLNRWLDWCAKMLDRLIETRKQDLFAKRPGSVVGNETKIIWLKMIDRPHVERSDPRFKVLSLRSKFNNAINTLVNDKKNNYCLDLESLESRHFSAIGELNDFGSMQYWKEFDYYFKKFDRRMADQGSRKEKEKTEPGTTKN